MKIRDMFFYLIEENVYYVLFNSISPIFQALNPVYSPSTKGQAHINRASETSWERNFISITRTEEKRVNLNRTARCARLLNPRFLSLM